MSETTENWYGDKAATLGDRLAAARTAADLSQSDLATQLGVEQERLDAWENDWEEPRANRLQMLTGLLGVSLRWLLTGVGEGIDGPDAAGTIPQDCSHSCPKSAPSGRKWRNRRSVWVSWKRN